MAGSGNRAGTITTEQRLEVQAQEIQRLRAQLTAQARTARQEAGAEMRARYRVAILILTVGALLVGGAIGHWGFPQAGLTAEAPSRISAPQGETVRPAAAIGSATVVAGDMTPWPVRVYVSGAVTAPKVVTLPAGSLLADALAAVGGPAADADLDGINLAAPVDDGQHVIVPRVGHPSQKAGDGVVTPTAPWPININHASAEALTALPYIGETKAAAIVDYRAANGAFETIADIQGVPGIGPATFEQIAHLITVGP
jgi:competence protein ComEA